MERRTREHLDAFLDDLYAHHPQARSQLTTLEKAGLTVRRAKPARGGKLGGSWLLFMEPAQHLVQSFALAPELLLVWSPFPTFQAVDIEACEHELGGTLRLDHGLVLVASADTSARDRLSQAVLRTGRVYLFLGMEDLVTTQSAAVWLKGRLLRELRSSDLFGSGRPVFGWDFVGRKNELAVVRRHLSQGHPVGLFGLRKVGKTSLLLALEGTVGLPASGASVIEALPIHLDLLAVGFSEQSTDGVLRALLRSTRAAVCAAGIERNLAAPLPDLCRIRHLSGANLKRETTDQFEVLLDWAATQSPDAKVLLFLDEYERLLSDVVLPRNDGLALLDYLRGLVQSHHGRFNFVLAGLSDALAGRSRFDDAQNPLFGFYVSCHLGGLNREETAELLRKLGRRLSLRFDDRHVVDMIYGETGGMPFLVRQFGRLVDQRIPVEHRLSTNDPIHLEVVQELRADFRRLVTESMREIGEAVSKVDPIALSCLANGTGDLTRSLSTLRPEVIDRLVGLGIVALGPGDAVRHRIECFEAWVRETQPTSQVDAA